MTLSFSPRYYQQAAVDAIWQALKVFQDNPCAELPTGAGKSWVLAMLAHDATTNWNGRVLILAHRKELLQQNFEKINALLPDEISLGIYSAGLKSRDTDSQVLVAGIQSVFSKGCELGGFDIVIVDEAHLIPTSGDGMYRTLIDTLKVLRPHVRIIGLTATPYRLKGGRVCRPENILNRICYRISVAELIEQEFLCPIYSNEAHAKIDTSGLHVRGGEFIQSEADALWEDDELIQRAVNEILERTKDRNKVLIFAQGINHSERVRELIVEAGCDCEGVYGHTSSTERDVILQEFQDGQIKYLTNCEVLTTGFDCTDIDCVVLLRPTASAGLYYQMVGRGFRIDPSKKNCLVLDFAGNIVRHGPVDELSQKMENSNSGNSPGETPMKTCPECEHMINISVMLCPHCGHEWEPEQSAGHDDKPTNAPILSSQGPKRPSVNYCLEPVQDINFRVHTKKGADEDHPKTLWVKYEFGLTNNASEWLCFEHTGFPRVKARERWNKFTGNTDYPANCADAKTELEMLQLPGGKFNWPVYVLMKHERGKDWPEIVQLIWESDLSDYQSVPGWEPVCESCGRKTFPQLKKKQCLYCSNWYETPTLVPSDLDGFYEDESAEPESQEYDRVSVEDMEVPF